MEIIRANYSQISACKSGSIIDLQNSLVVSVNALQLHAP
jgi:hypothetical protein